MAEPETPATAPPTTPNQATGPADAGPQRPPLREALDALERAAGNLREKDPSLADRVRDLVAQAADPVRFNQREFRHEIAYAVQDTEKALGHLIDGLAQLSQFVAAVHWQPGFKLTFGDGPCRVLEPGNRTGQTADERQPTRN